MLTRKARLEVIDGCLNWIVLCGGIGGLDIAFLDFFSSPPICITIIGVFQAVWVEDIVEGYLSKPWNNTRKIGLEREESSKSRCRTLRTAMAFSKILN